MGTTWIAVALAGAGMAVALAGCDAAPETLSVDSAWVRLPAVPSRPGAAYFIVHGGPKSATLISVRTDVAIASEMHETVSGGMRPLATVTIPAGQDVAFAPGGRHVMLFDLNPGVKPGRLIDLTLTFSDGTRLVRKATAVAPGGSPS